MLSKFVASSSQKSNFLKISSKLSSSVRCAKQFKCQSSLKHRQSTSFLSAKTKSSVRWFKSIFRSKLINHCSSCSILKQLCSKWTNSQASLKCICWRAYSKFSTNKCSKNAKKCTPTSLDQTQNSNHLTTSWCNSSVKSPKLINKNSDSVNCANSLFATTSPLTKMYKRN